MPPSTTASRPCWPRMVPPSYHAGAQEAYARDHVSHDLHRTGLVGEPQPEIGEGRGPARDPHVGAQPRSALPVLPLRPD